MICRKQLSTGEGLYVLEDNKFICKDDYISGKNGQGTLFRPTVVTARFRDETRVHAKKTGRGGGEKNRKSINS